MYCLCSPCFNPQFELSCPAEEAPNWRARGNPWSLTCSMHGVSISLRTFVELAEGHTRPQPSAFTILWKTGHGASRQPIPGGGTYDATPHPHSPSLLKGASAVRQGLPNLRYENGHSAPRSASPVLHSISDLFVPDAHIQGTKETGGRHTTSTPQLSAPGSTDRSAQDRRQSVYARSILKSHRHALHLSRRGLPAKITALGLLTFDGASLHTTAFLSLAYILLFTALRSWPASYLLRV